jgi:hypothetical protein
MTTTDQVLIIILSVLLIIFFSLLIAVTVGLLKIVSMVKQVVAKAELVVDNVESATEVIRDASGPMAAIRVLRNIIKMTNRNSKGRK